MSLESCSDPETGVCEKRSSAKKSHKEVDYNNFSIIQCRKEITGSVYEKLYKICGGKPVFEAIEFLFWVFLDFILDIYTARVHFVQGRVTEGLLTISIVVVAGCIVTFILHISIQRRTNYKEEAASRGIFWRILLRVPGLTPIFSGMIRLHYANQVVKPSDSSAPKCCNTQLQLKNFKIGSAWDQMFEGFYENFPQAILQIVVLLEKRSFDSSDLYAVMRIIMAVRGIAMGPLNLLTACNEKKDVTFFEQGIATMSKVVMLLCFSFSIVSWRFLFSDSLIFGTSAGIIMIIVCIDLPFVYIDGYAGRYPPVLKMEDVKNGNENNKNRILSRLQKGYYILFTVYGLIALLYPSLWLYCDTMYFESTQQRIINRALVLCVYFATLITSVSLYLLNRRDLWLGGFFPYFLGMLIVRIVRRSYKLKGKLDDFGNGTYIHNLIGT